MKMKNFENNMRTILFSVFICLLLGVLIAGLYDEIYVKSARAENANWLCRWNGYDSYEDFVSVPLDEKPYGLRCKNIPNKQDVALTVLPGVAEGGNTK